MVIREVDSGLKYYNNEMYTVKQFFHRRNSCNCLKSVKRNTM
jgi:hypothetical protein